jgi:hypothetical protein
MPLREETNVVAVYVYPTRSSGKAKWMLELATRGGPRILWGSAPGLEARDEPSLVWKIKRLREITSQRELWSQPEFDLSHPTEASTESKPPARLSHRL